MSSLRTATTPPTPSTRRSSHHDAASAIHNFSDALTAVPLFIAFRLARRPPTRRYTYGYGRAGRSRGPVRHLDDRPVRDRRRLRSDPSARLAPGDRPPGLRRRRGRGRLPRQRARRPLPHPRRQRHRLGRPRRRRLPRPHRRFHLPRGCRRCHRRVGPATRVPMRSQDSSSRLRSSPCCASRSSTCSVV